MQTNYLTVYTNTLNPSCRDTSTADTYNRVLIYSIDIKLCIICIMIDCV